MLPDAPETISELIPYLVVTAVLAAGALWRATRGALARLGTWALERFTYYLKRDAEDLKGARAQNVELVATEARLRQQLKALHRDAATLVERTTALSLMLREGHDQHPDPGVEAAREAAVLAKLQVEEQLRATPEGA